MKSLITLFIAIFLLTGNHTFTIAKGGKGYKDNQTNTIASLLLGLKSENKGLRSGSAYMLGELRVESAVIPLMKVLRNDSDVDVRISAALALYKLGTSISISAVKKAIRFDESKRLRKLARCFYSEYLKEQNRNNNIDNNYFAQSE